VFGRRSYWPIASGCLVRLQWPFYSVFVKFQTRDRSGTRCAPPLGATVGKTPPMSAGAASWRGVRRGPVLQSLWGLLFSHLLRSHEIERVRNVHQQGQFANRSVRRTAWGHTYSLVPSAPLRFVGVRATQAPDISCGNTGRRRRSTLAMSVVNYNLPINRPRVLHSLWLLTMAGCGLSWAHARRSRRACQRSGLFMVSPWLQGYRAMLTPGLQ